KVIGEMSGAAFGHRVGDDLEIVRGTLCRILMDAVPGAETIFGDSVASMTPSGDGTEVAVTFTSGATRNFDLVIGADGLHSNIRQKVFGDEAQFLVDLGMYLCVYSVPNYLNLDRTEMQYSEVGRVAALWSTRDAACAKACFGFAARFPIGLRDQPQQQRAIRTVY